MIKKFLQLIKEKLSKLSFQTGIIITVICVPFYLLSFGQILLPLDNKTHVILWTVLFGLAKAFQYAGLTIIGAEGIKKIKEKYFKKQNSNQSTEIN